MSLHMERQPPAGIMDRGRLGHATPPAHMNGGRMIYEFAQREDLKAISALLISCQLPDNDLEGHPFIVAKTAGRMIGCIGLEMQGPLLRSMAVDPEFRNHGIAGELYRRLLEHAKTNQLSEIYLLTDAAEKFFERRGFEKIDRDEAPEWIRKHKQFTTLCPDSAVVMRIHL
jgi:amino-acid N-acetyltransferase